MSDEVQTPNIQSQDTTNDSTLPPHFSAAVDKNGRTYYLNHIDQTTSYNHHNNVSSAGLPDHVERKVDQKGRSYYMDHQSHTSSWLHPMKLSELKELGIVAEGRATTAEEEVLSSKPWVVEEIAAAPEEGTPYYVDYRTGKVDSVSPEDKAVAREAAEKRRAEREQ
ncbi:hypothetical protein MMC30_002479 [Trapelia coarctata]|nr:hypothetical protein [Trapelia coarctata]